MIYLIDYDRRAGRLLSTTPFSEERREEAQNLRLEIELSLARQGIDREVILLEAANENALRRTHRRYFEDLAALVESPK